MLVVVADSNVVRAASADPTVSPAGTNGGNDTAPPPVVTPPPPPDELQRSVEPGTITQGWDNSSPVSQIRDQRDVALLSSTNETTYETAYGYFVLNQSAPYFVSVLSPDGTGTKIADSAFLVRFQGMLLQPANGTVDNVTSGQLSFHYGLYLNASLQGTMTVDYRFRQDTNNITVSFAPSSGVPSDQFQIVWLSFTTFDIVDVTTMPADVEQRLEDLKGFGGLVMIPSNYEVLSATGMTDTVVKPTKGASFNREAAGLHVNVDDALNDSPSTYAGKFSFAGYSGNAVVTMFAAGHLTIDPQLIAPVQLQAAKEFSGIQRKTFFDGDRYWLFVIRSASNVISYTSSTDGRNWDPLSIAHTTNPSGTLAYGFTVINSGKTVVVLWTDSAWPYAIQVKTGLIAADSIQWDAVGHQLYDGNGTGNTIRRPVSAAFTSQGSQFGLTWSDTGGAIGFARYTCTGQGSSGLSPCATQVLSGAVDWGYGASGGYQYSLVAPFNDGSGSIARVKVDSVPLDGKSYIRAKVYRDDGTSCGDTYDLVATGEASGDDWMNLGFFTATAAGPYVDLFVWVYKDPIGFVFDNIVRREIDSNCAELQPITIAVNAIDAKYLTSGVESTGGAAYLFFGSGSPTTIHKVRAIPGNRWAFNEEPIISSLSPYTNSSYLTAASVSL